MAKMFKSAMLGLAGVGMLATAMPAVAHDHDRGYRNGYGYGYQGGYQGGYGGYNGDDDDRGYNRSYNEPVYRNTRVWQGQDGRYYCRHQDGTTGLLVGGAAGALIGRGLAGRYGDQTLGAILGAGIGALVGRQVEKSNSRCR